MNSQEDWRKVFSAQYNMFGTVAGLEIAALSIFAGFNKPPLLLAEKIIFTLTASLLFSQIALLIWMLNQERRVAFGDPMTAFKENERTYRAVLILIIISTWAALLALLLVNIWK